VLVRYFFMGAKRKRTPETEKMPEAA